MKTIRIAHAQINTTVGDLEGNATKIIDWLNRVGQYKVDIVVFPELTTTGYPPEDLLLKQKFISDNLAILETVAGHVGNITAILGFVDRKKGQLYNAAAIISNKKVRAVYRKMLLPNYGVFDEKRYFAEGKEATVFRWRKNLFGIGICEDIWFKDGPTAQQASRGATIVININASPYHMGKNVMREAVVRERARENGVYVCYANLVGGQDELVFDGQSMVVGPDGNVISRARAFEEDLFLVDLPVPHPFSLKGGRQRPPIPEGQVTPMETEPEVYEALKLGLHDYVEKNGFKNVVIGISGGIDSALVAALAVDALGSKRVNGVFMPTVYSSSESASDAKQLADNLNIKLMVIPVQDIYGSYLNAFAPFFEGRAEDVTEENIQARIRGNILMALSNKFGWLVLTTGNKSEMSVGYATLYGDMAGGFAVIKDVPKTLVYRLSMYRNTRGYVIPERILTKEPTAELKPGQKDSDSLPPYEMLDPVLKSYVEEDKDPKEIVLLTTDKKVTQKVVLLVDRSEYKRRQSPPGIKITPKAFGKDRRMPITNRYKGMNHVL